MTIPGMRECLRANLLAAIVLWQSATPAEAYYVVSNGMPPPELMAQAEEWLATRVGSEYAKSQYKLEPAQCSITTAAGTNEILFYGLVYRYEAHARIGVANPFIHVSIDVLSKSVSGHPACFDESGRVVEPSVDLAAATRILRSRYPEPHEHGPPGELRFMGCHLNAKRPYWTSSLPTGSGGGCWTSRAIRIDAFSGELSEEEESTACE